MKPLSYTQLQKRYGGKFIARLNGQVIAWAETSRKLWDKVRDKIGSQNMVIEYIEPQGAICIYGIPYPEEKN